jgi:hypothetical protein
MLFIIPDCLFASTSGLFRRLWRCKTALLSPPVGNGFRAARRNKECHPHWQMAFFCLMMA